MSDRHRTKSSQDGGRTVGQRDRLTDGRLNKMDGQTDRMMDTQTNGQMERITDQFTNGLHCRQIGRPKARLIDRCTDGWTDKIDRCIDRRTDR